MKSAYSKVHPLAAMVIVALLLASVATVAVGTRAAADGELYPTWYLAEGSIAWGFTTYITIENPNDSQVTVRVTYMPTSGASTHRDITMPAESQTTIWGDVIWEDINGAKDFSTKVDCLDGKTICVDRTMTWTGPGAASEEGHSSVGVTAPETTWYLPEGSSNWGFECWLLIQNPDATATANCQVTYMKTDSAPVTKTHTVGPHSRATFSMQADVGSCDASIKVESDIPVIPERAMYKNNRREGHDSIGVHNVWKNSYLAEGSTAWGFTTYVLIQNPNGFDNRVNVTYMTPSGAQTQPSFVMGAYTRKTIRVNDVLPNTDFSTQVSGTDGAVIAERAMYWGAGTPLGEACHDSIGMTLPHSTFYLPDGWSGYTPVLEKTYETWTLVQNPNSVPVEVRLTYLTYNGMGDQSVTATIPANSRKSFNMAAKITNNKAATKVECLTTGRKIMCERAMYWNNRGAGTDTIGGFSD
jgi:hypothetical protein